MDRGSFHYRHSDGPGDRCRLFHLYVQLALRRWYSVAGSDVTINAQIGYWALLLHLLPPPNNCSLPSLLQVEGPLFRDQG